MDSFQTKLTNAASLTDSPTNYSSTYVHDIGENYIWQLFCCPEKIFWMLIIHIDWQRTWTLSGLFVKSEDFITAKFAPVPKFLKNIYTSLPPPPNSFSTPHVIDQNIQ